MFICGSYYYRFDIRLRKNISVDTQILENISSNNTNLLKVHIKMLGSNYIMQLKNQFNSTFDKSSFFL